MSPAIRPHTLLFYQVITLLSLIVLVSGVGGLSLVWLRQQIAETAGRTQSLQRERHDVTRRIEYLDVKIAEVQRPVYLESRAREMGLVLRRPEVGQLVALGPLAPLNAPFHVEDDPRAPVEREPYKNSFDLAVMEPLRRSSN